MGREDVFVQGGLAVFNFHHRLIQEWESKVVSSGEDDDVNGLFLWDAVKQDGVFLYLLHTWLDEHFSGEDIAWEIVIYHKFFQMRPKQKHKRDLPVKTQPTLCSLPPFFIWGLWLGRRCQSFFFPF